VDSTLVSAVSWLTEAPMLPRVAEMELMALVMAVRADEASVLVEREAVFRPRDVDERESMVVVKVAAPPLVPSLVKTVAESLPATVGEKEPRTASVLETLSESPETALEMTTLPPEMVRAVPVLRVPPAAAAMADCRLAMVELAPAVNLKVPPVALSVMVVTEPAVRSVVVARGTVDEPSDEVTELVELPLKTEVPLKLVVEPIWLISLRMEVNSVSSAVDWEVVGNGAVELRGDLGEGAVGSLQQAYAV
jgi:hypothetical protein